MLTSYTSSDEENIPYLRKDRRYRWLACVLIALQVVRTSCPGSRPLQFPCPPSLPAPPGPEIPLKKIFYSQCLPERVFLDQEIAHIICVKPVWGRTSHSTFQGCEALHTFRYKFLEQFQCFVWIFYCIDDVTDVSHTFLLLKVAFPTSEWTYPAEQTFQCKYSSRRTGRRNHQYLRTVVHKCG